MLTAWEGMKFNGFSTLLYKLAELYLVINFVPRLRKAPIGVGAPIGLSHATSPLVGGIHHRKECLKRCATVIAKACFARRPQGEGTGGIVRIRRFGNNLQPAGAGQTQHEKRLAEANCCFGPPPLPRRVEKPMLDGMLRWEERDFSRG
jgi:hypothetical protein